LYNREYEKLTDENIAILDKLNEQRKKSGKSYVQIANEVGMSESTVIRIYSGKQKNLSVTDVIKLWKLTGGGNAVDLFNDNIKVDVVTETPQVVVPQIDEKLYNQIIDIYKDQLKEKDRRITVLIGLVATLIVSLVAVCIVALI
jgi:transcriptional regulator with XRE-family HTH domain